MPEINAQTVDLINSTVKEVLERMGILSKISARIVQNEQGQEIVLTNIETREGGILIGHEGTNLEALQYLVRLLLRRKSKEIVSLALDVNSYKKNKERHLKELALKLASQIKNSGRQIVLKPMSARERRIIHLTLADQNGVRTESIGEEPSRRIVIKPQEK